MLAKGFPLVDVQIVCELGLGFWWLWVSAVFRAHSPMLNDW